MDSSQSISYASSIASHREPAKDNPEEFVRALTVLHLVHDLGYKPELLILEYRVDAKVGRKSGPKWVDIAILKNNNSLWSLVEIKRPSLYETEYNNAWEGQLFGLSRFIDSGPEYLIYGTVNVETPDSPTFHIVDASRFKTYNSWQKSGAPILSRTLSERYRKPHVEVFRRGGGEGVDLSTNVSREELSRLQVQLHNVLWGGGDKTDSDIFNLLTRIILAKYNDEVSTSPGDKYVFQITDNEEDISDVLQKIDELYRKGMLRYLRKQIEQYESVRRKDQGNDEQIRFVINKLAPYNLSEIAASSKGQDIIGSFFERVMRTGFKQSKGQFFTHLNIVDFIIDVVGLGELAVQNALSGEDLPTVIDPSAGSGSFVIRAMLKMADSIRSAEPDATSDLVHSIFNKVKNGVPINRWAREHCVGLEINPDLGLAAQVNMLLHGDGSSSMLAGNVYGNGLADFSVYPNTSILAQPSVHPVYKGVVCEQFDAVLTNPPFASDIPATVRQSNSSIFPISQQDGSGEVTSEDLFCDRWFQLLKPNGRLAAVLPNSVFDARSNNRTRDWLLRYFWVRAVVSLPADAFYPHTNTKTSIVFAQKKKVEEVRKSHTESTQENLLGHEKIQMAKATYLGYKRTTKKEYDIDRNDLIDIADDLRMASIWQQ